MAGDQWGFLGFRDLPEKFAFRALPLIKCVAVRMPMLTHIQASRTDALKTHFPQTFLINHRDTKSPALITCTQISCPYILKDSRFSSTISFII